MEGCTAEGSTVEGSTVNGEGWAEAIRASEALTRSLLNTVICRDRRAHREGIVEVGREIIVVALTLAEEGGCKIVRRASTSSRTSR